MWSRCRVDVRSMRGRCGVYVRSIIINEGERLVTPPSPIFYKRGALLSEGYFTIRTGAVQTKKCGTVTIITTFLNNVLEISFGSRK